jgi:hypothetical protein
MSKFKEKIAKLGFAQKDNFGEYEIDASLLLCDKSYETDVLAPEEILQLELARGLNATAVFFIQELSKSKAQIYLYDFTHKALKEEIELTKIQKQIWSSGVVPIVCAFYKTEVKILDCTQPTENDKPQYLETLRYSQKATTLFNEQFAVKIKTGIFWENEKNQNKFKFSKSAYSILIDWIKVIIANTEKLNTGCEDRIVKKVIVQTIMIKYFEERKDEDGKSPFSEEYYKKHLGELNLVSLLQSGKTNGNTFFIKLLDLLSIHFNGNLFNWSDEEKKQIRKLDLSDLIDALEGYRSSCEDPNLKLIRYYDFSCVPVELISRIYEEFLAGNNKKEQKQIDGIFYTPSHLARLLVDEMMPLNKFNDIDLSDYKVLDPACGSGIFLALAFKRLVQWWRLQNNMNLPNVKKLKELLRCIHGVDKEEQATKLTAFSLCFALSDELSPKVMVSELKFDDLTHSNIIHSDFFIEELELPFDESQLKGHQQQKENFRKLKNKKFNIIIGNPPFKNMGRQVDNATKNFWKAKFNDIYVDIPSKQIALKFLISSKQYLKNDGFLCLLQKSTNLLYNTRSRKFKEVLFKNYNIRQILDFTHLYEKNLLWDNGARVAAAAIFIQNTNIENNQNILHLTMRPTKQTKNRINFEIDDYDLHFISREEAIHNHNIWKINLLGGGRLKSLIANLYKYDKIDDIFNGETKEGLWGGRNLPNIAFSKSKLDYSFVDEEYLKSYENSKDKPAYSTPNLMIKEDLSLPLAINHRRIPFSNQITSFFSSTEEELIKIKNCIDKNRDVLKCYLISTSGKALINKDTVINKQDIMSLPFSGGNDEIFDLDEIDKTIVDETNTFFYDFMTKRANSTMLNSIIRRDFEPIITHFGKNFCKILNQIYQLNNKKFRLSNIDFLKTKNTHDTSYIVSIFKYDDKEDNPQWSIDKKEIDLNPLTNYDISSRLKSKRIIKLYDKKDTIILIKPNQYRYWLSSIAFRDADKSIIDLTNAGY